MNDKSFVVDYSNVCRTCLQSNVDMINLSMFINDNNKEGKSKISYMECLLMCTQFEDSADVELPQLICLECASALQVVYWFTTNATQAQELLKQKLLEIRRKKLNIENNAASEGIKKSKRYRCKICNEKVETKKSLKDHVKLHLDIIVYTCQLCSFETHNRHSLSDHYIQMHCLEPTKEQLKPKTKLSSTFSSSSPKISVNDRLDGAIKNEYFQLIPEDLHQNSNQSFSKPVITTNSSCNTASLQFPTIIPTNPKYTTIPLEREQNHDFRIANEFMVMADGSLEKVQNKGVVIEYIDTINNGNLTLDDGLVLDNIMPIQNIDNTAMLQQNLEQMDFDDLIIEDSGDVMEEIQSNIILPLEEETIPATIIQQPKKTMCKICTKDFCTQEELKYHMLTHNEIPHFFCDGCKFYTFFRIDLQQHYKSKHNIQPTNKQLQPRNKQKINEVYACDFCFYETEVKLDLKKHYKTKHNIEAKEIHSRPIKGEKLKTKFSPLPSKIKSLTKVNEKPEETSKIIKIQSPELSAPDYPNGLNCRKCHEVFYWRKKLYEHYKMHNAEEAALKQQNQLIKIGTISASSIICGTKAKTVKTHSPQTSNIVQTPGYSSLGTLDLNVTTSSINTINSLTALTPSSSSTYTLPSDAIPQIVEMDHTIENFDFDFNCDDDVLFRDFGDDDVDVENDSDENDSEFRNVLLTSDDDFEDLLLNPNDNSNALVDAAASGSYCGHCQKSFLSQYQFENHMFVHRGLAPYRCEMCTNIYNTKRCLVRHYKAVHKNVPSRDMIQAKGDKVCDDKTPVELLKLEATSCFMCAKCPYESSELNNIKFHLQSSHNINDESYVMKKLPFECPRCIRSYESKLKLLRHLERNHSLTPINQLQPRFNSMANTAELETSTSISTTINNHVNMTITESSETNASCDTGYSDIFAKQERELHQSSGRDAIARQFDVTLFGETTSATSRLVYNQTSINSNNAIITLSSFSDVYATLPLTPIALDDNDTDQALFKCKICLLTCYTIETFNEHIKRIECRKIDISNAGDRVLFECEICHCNYKTMYLLKHHLKRHIARKFPCDNCPKTFINKVELEAHKHVHSGERPHKCDACTKSFRYVHHLKRHKDSAHFGKRHACKELNCDRKFTTLAQLKVHMWTHNGIVPYKCPICNRVYKKRLLLREHCVKVHYINLSEEEMAKIFRNSLGYTNPHDFTVTIGNGKMLRRGDVETMIASGVIKSSFN